MFEFSRLKKISYSREREESTSQPPESNDERSMEIANADEKLFRIFQTIFALPGIMTLKK